MRVGFVHDILSTSETVRDFYRSYWPRGIALSDEVFYDWQFKAPPTCAQKDQCVIAFDEEKGKIIGVMGLNSRPFFLNGSQKSGAELTTWIVDPESRGSGAGARILSFIQANFDVLIGLGISSQALPIYMKSGFRYVRAIPRFVKVMKFEAIQQHCVYDRTALKLMSQWSVNEVVKFSVQQIFDYEYGCEEIHESLVGQMNFFTRDARHRKWRYCDHPVFSYKQFVVSRADGEGAGSAFVALREETSLQDFKILHVMDVFGVDLALPAAFSFIEDYARVNDFDVVDFFCTSSRVFRVALATGWFSITDDVSFQFPHLFHPIEMRNPPTTSLVYWTRDRMLDMADTSRLYITKQDADMDRPTLHTLLNRKL